MILGDVIILKLKDALASNMKYKWNINDKTNIIEYWTNVDTATVKEYQRDVNQCTTNDVVSSNCLRDLLRNSRDEELCSKIDEAYLQMAGEGYLGGCLYLKIAFDMMFCMET